MANAVEEALSRASNKDKQTIDAAKEHIKGFDNADKVIQFPTSPTAQPKPQEAEKVQLDAASKSNIESIQQSQGNNYQNAVDRAQSRPAQEPQKAEQQQARER